MPAGKCGEDSCECPTGECILRLAICDDYGDCDDGEDEVDCDCRDNMVNFNYSSSVILNHKENNLLFIHEKVL